MSRWLTDIFRVYLKKNKLIANEYRLMCSMAMSLCIRTACSVLVSISTRKRQSINHHARSKPKWKNIKKRHVQSGTASRATLPDPRPSNVCVSTTPNNFSRNTRPVEGRVALRRKLLTTPCGISRCPWPRRRLVRSAARRTWAWSRGKTPPSPLFVYARGACHVSALTVAKGGRRPLPLS